MTYDTRISRQFPFFGGIRYLFHLDSMQLTSNFGAHLLELQAQGNIPKTKSLEEVLKSSSEMEAKLIGYDETPIDVVLPDVIGFDKLNVQEPCRRNFNSKMHIKEERNGDSSCIKPVLQPPPSFEAVKIQPSETRGNPSCDANSQAKGTVNVSCTSRVSSMEYFSNFLTLRKSSRRITQSNSKSSFV